MSRSILGTQVLRAFGGLTSGVRRSGRRFRTSSFIGVESLEERRLLADSIIPSAVISSTPQGADFKYDITLTNSASSNAPIGTFWFAWVPGEDFLATAPTSVTPPTGWVDNITNAGTTDGFAIQFIAGSTGTTNPVEPGSSMSFSFVSADTPAELMGNSVFYPTTPVLTSFVYNAAPFSDAGFQFVVTPAVAAPTVTALSPTSGPAAGGTTVTITGTTLTGATAVDFGTTPATDVTVVNDTTVTAVSPAGTGTEDVTVTTPAGTSATSAADQFTFVAAPTVTALDPTSGPAAGGTTVTITGTGLRNGP
jgi:IPT/TIG domain